MNIDYFKNIRILDGGMGQELLRRGLKPKGTLWSANALIDENYHKLVIDTHCDFIKSGAEVIVTNTFATRRMRLKENGVENQFEKLNIIACQLANKAKEKSKTNILIAGGLPPQNLTYLDDNRDDEKIKMNYYEQAIILDPYIDFFYFDVLSSMKEFKLGIEAIKEFNKPYLIGIHISEGTKLPSGETITDVINSINTDKILGVMLSCVSPENYLLNINELQKTGFPFGFKINGFKNTLSSYAEKYSGSQGNPNKILGIRNDLSNKKIFEFTKKTKDMGATILGGCCEIKPSQIREISKIRN